MFSVFGTFIGSMYIMTTCAKELVAVLIAFGIIYNMSDSFIALSVLTWGNNIGTLVASIGLALEGHSEMVITACFSGPILSEQRTTKYVVEFLMLVALTSPFLLFLFALD